MPSELKLALTLIAAGIGALMFYVNREERDARHLSIEKHKRLQAEDNLQRRNEQLDGALAKISELADRLDAPHDE